MCLETANISSSSMSSRGSGFLSAKWWRTFSAESRKYFAADCFARLFGSSIAKKSSLALSHTAQTRVVNGPNRAASSASVVESWAFLRGR